MYNKRYVLFDNIQQYHNMTHTYVYCGNALEYAGCKILTNFLCRIHLINHLFKDKNNSLWSFLSSVSK